MPSGDEAAAEEVVDESSSSDDSSSSSGSAAPAEFDTEKYFVVNALSGATWTGAL